MQGITQETIVSSKEPMRKSWKIAWCHSGDSGGSKRATFDMVRELSHRGRTRVRERIVNNSDESFNLSCRFRHWSIYGKG